MRSRTKIASFALIIIGGLMHDPHPALANCQSSQAQENLSWLITEQEVSAYLRGGCSSMMDQVFIPRIIARKNQARLEQTAPKNQNTIPGYQIQYRDIRSKTWVAGPTYLSPWECSDAQWAPGVIGARCVEVQVQTVN